MKKRVPHTPKRLSRTPLKKLVILGLVILIGFVGILWGLDKVSVINLPFLSNNGTTTDTTNGINYGPPTEEEKQETEDFKNKQGDSTSTPPTTPPAGQKKSVTPTISSWGYNKLNGNVEVSGYVPGIIEDGGTCTLTLEKASQKETESKASTADAQNTSCGLITVAGNRLSNGSWKATLTYGSDTANGSSQAVTVEVN